MKIISGMHRSGTSLVARMFYEAGADMGDPRTFYRPDKWNPDGYFEQPDIHAINMPLINHFLWKFAYFFLPSTKTILRRAGRRSQQIRKTAGEYKGRVIKETRFCLTLSAWLAHGAQVSQVMVCLRPPIQVARSLKKRNHISVRHAFGLWKTHNERLLEHAKGIPLWFVKYENLISEKGYLDEARGAFDFFDLRISDQQMLAVRQKAVNPNMNHWPENDYDYPDSVKILWLDLLRKHEAQW